jgi:hypothetical protein
MLNKKLDVEKNEAWCTVSVQDVNTRVAVRHVGKGKFKIVNDEMNGNLVGNILDASDIFHC